MIFIVIFRDFFRLCKIHQAPPSYQQPLNSSESCLKSPYGVMINFWKKSKVPFLYGPSPRYKAVYTGGTKLESDFLNKLIKLVLTLFIL